MVMSTISGPKPKRIYTKFGSIARTNTTAKNLFVLPKGSTIVGAFVLGPVASDAQTTATISVGTGSNANELVSAYDVKTGATGLAFETVGGKAIAALFTPLTADTLIKGIYAETGTASATGGPWTVRLDYVVNGPGDSITEGV